MEEPGYSVPSELVDEARKELLLYKTKVMPRNLANFPMIRQYWREPWFFELAFELGLCLSVRTGSIKDKAATVFISTASGISKDLAKLLHISALLFKAQKVVCDGVVTRGGHHIAAQCTPQANRMETEE